MGKLSLVGEYLNRTRHRIVHLMGKVKHLLPHFLAVRRDFQARIHQCSPRNVDVLAGVSVLSVRKLRQTDGETEQEGRLCWQLRKEKYAKIRQGGRRLGGPQTGSGAFEKRRNVLLLPGIEL